MRAATTPPAEVTMPEAGGRVRAAEGALSGWFRSPGSPASGSGGGAAGEVKAAGPRAASEGKVAAGPVGEGVRVPPGGGAAREEAGRAGHGAAAPASRAPRGPVESCGSCGIRPRRRRALAPGLRPGVAPAAGPSPSCRFPAGLALGLVLGAGGSGALRRGAAADPEPVSVLGPAGVPWWSLGVEAEWGVSRGCERCPRGACGGDQEGLAASEVPGLEETAYSLLEPPSPNTRAWVAETTDWE